MTHVRDDVDNEIMLINGHAYINDISGPIPVLSVGVKGSPLRNIVGCGWKTAIMEIPVIYVAEQKSARGQVVYGGWFIYRIEIHFKDWLKPSYIYLSPLRISTNCKRICLISSSGRVSITMRQP